MSGLVFFLVPFYQLPVAILLLWSWCFLPDGEAAAAPTADQSMQRTPGRSVLSFFAIKHHHDSRVPSVGVADLVLGSARFNHAVSPLNRTKDQS